MLNEKIRWYDVKACQFTPDLHPPIYITTNLKTLSNSAILKTDKCCLFVEYFSYCPNRWLFLVTWINIKRETFSTNVQTPEFQVFH